MEVLETTKKLCLCCMEVHDVKKVEVSEVNTFKNESVEVKAIYEYCSNTKEYIETEEMIRLNDLSFKDAYRRKKHLKTSNEIVE